ncbi:hypothetical protein AVEN_183563-1 [Araneus ventricosus]|uniref:Uncharacterized protein n=1 Tax=Araneus ventricosus TaxID=182803 RepID=A0A4Y2RR76_ARAVE|nr:hypothetical protein AVEN_183563-1 [Araneus ventricosus]
MQKEEYEEWMSIDKDILVTAILIDLEIFQAVCEQDQAIRVDDSDRDECVEENPSTNTEMRQDLDILKRGVQHRSTNFKKQYDCRRTLRIPGNEYPQLSCSDQMTDCISQSAEHSIFLNNLTSHNEAYRLPSEIKMASYSEQQRMSGAS